MASNLFEILTLRYSKLKLNSRDAKKAENKLWLKALSSPEILVIDDDPLFRKSMEHFGRRYELKLTTCASRDEILTLSTNKYDVAIVDYFLGTQERGTDAAAILGATPVLMVSSEQCNCLEDNALWPNTVRRFLSKEVGFKNLLSAAIQLSGKGEARGREVFRVR